MLFACPNFSGTDYDIIEGRRRGAKVRRSSYIFSVETWFSYYDHTMKLGRHDKILARS